MLELVLVWFIDVRDCAIIMSLHRDLRLIFAKSYSKHVKQTLIFIWEMIQKRNICMTPPEEMV